MWLTQTWGRIETWVHGEVPSGFSELQTHVLIGWMLFALLGFTIGVYDWCKEQSGWLLLVWLDEGMCGRGFLDVQTSTWFSLALQVP